MAQNSYFQRTQSQAQGSAALSLLSSWKTIGTSSNTSYVVIEVSNLDRLLNSLGIFYTRDPSAVHACMSQISACRPLSPNPYCMDLELAYTARVFAYLGSLSYSSTTMSVSTSNPSLLLGPIVAQTTNSSITVSWSAPSAPVTRFRIWLRYNAAHNGYLDPSRVPLTKELVPLVLTDRMEVIASQSSITLSGCFNDTSTWQAHCITPWTLYRVFVAAVDDSSVGQPSSSTISTMQGVNQAPTSISVSQVSSTSATVRWRAASPLVAPIYQFSLVFTNTYTMAQYTFTLPNDRNASTQATNPSLYYEKIVTGITPYSTFTLHITPFSDGSTGDTSAAVLVSTLEGVPSQMAAVTVTSLDDASDHIEWKAPDPLPGVILKYELSTGYEAGVTEAVIIYQGLALSVTVAADSKRSYRIRATTSAGTGPWSELPAVDSSSSNFKISDPKNYGSIAGAGALLVLLTIAAVYWYRRRQQALKALRFVKPEPDEWEYDPAGLKLGAKLGEGAFGVVMSGTATNIQPDLHSVVKVAVKMCSPNATDKDKMDFIAEAAIMKKFSKPWHVNVRLPCSVLFVLCCC